MAGDTVGHSSAEAPSRGGSPSTLGTSVRVSRAQVLGELPADTPVPSSLPQRESMHVKMYAESFNGWRKEKNAQGLKISLL